MSDPTEIRSDEFHPAARSAYRWLKGFMVTNPEEYSQYRLAIEIAAIDGNRQAQICWGTIQRLKDGRPISDRYLMGLAWTILHMHNHEAMEGVADKRIDQAYPKIEAEL
jgi:hypothetical protein